MKTMDSLKKETQWKMVFEAVSAVRCTQLDEKFKWESLEVTFRSARCFVPSILAPPVTE